MASASLRGLTAAQSARLQQIYDDWNNNPGRAPGGSGLTGLNSNDMKGYSDMLNEQTEGLNLENTAQGKAPMRVSYGGEIPSQGHGIADDPDSLYNTTTGPFGAFGQGTGGQSASLLGLEQAGKPSGSDVFAVKPKKYRVR